MPDSGRDAPAAPEGEAKRVNVNTVEPPMKRLLWGGAAGVAVGAAAWLLTGAIDLVVFSWPHAAAFVLGAGAVCALGRLIFRRTLGALVGLLMGFLLGFSVGQPTAAASRTPLVGEPAPIAGRTLDVETSVRQPLAGDEANASASIAVPKMAWTMALLGALVAAFFQLAAETGAGAGRT